MSLALGNGVERLDKHTKLVCRGKISSQTQVHGRTLWTDRLIDCNPIFILQKKAVPVMAFSSFNHHSSQLFKPLEIIKFSDPVTFVNATFMYKFNHQFCYPLSSSPSSPSTIHSYNTRHSAKLYYQNNNLIPSAKTKQRRIPMSHKALVYPGFIFMTRKWISTQDWITYYDIVVHPKVQHW